jgi:hypothetical protein
MELGVAAHGSRAELNGDSGKRRAARYSRSGGAGRRGGREHGAGPSAMGSWLAARRDAEPAGPSRSWAKSRRGAQGGQGRVAGSLAKVGSQLTSSVVAFAASQLGGAAPRLRPATQRLTAS